MKVSELTNGNLDYWVGKVSGKTIMPDGDGWWFDENGFEYSPSTEWADGGPIIERELSPLIPYEDEKSAEGIWKVGDAYKCQLKGMGFVGEGRTILEAAMRAYVGDKFGNEVDDS